MRTEAEVQRAAENTARITLALVAAKRERDRARVIAAALEAQTARVEDELAAWEKGIEVDVALGSSKQAVEAIQRLIGHVRAALNEDRP